MGNSESVVNWRTRVKYKLVIYKGGKCEICGYDKMCLGAYHFHHLDPLSKKFAIGGLTTAFDKLKNEADKCQLLCSNCHAEIHEKQFHDTKVGVISDYVNKITEPIIIHNKECVNCGINYHSKSVSSRFCCSKCCRYSYRKVKNRPGREEILNLLETHSMVAVGKLYGVTDNAVKKWLI